MTIAEIKDDVLIMKDGTLRSLIGFRLNFRFKVKTANAIVAGYVSFLNF
jgi:hypothetical protein